MSKSTQAKGLDLAAKAMHKSATAAAGKTGGKLADLVANLLLAPVRRRS
jgi:hypothetical protein